ITLHHSIVPVVPSSQRRGGCAIKKRREATLDAQTGWSEMCLTTPAAPIKGCLRRYFLEVAATPPLEEGTICFLLFFARWATPAPTMRVTTVDLRGNHRADAN